MFKKFDSTNDAPGVNRESRNAELRMRLWIIALSGIIGVSAIVIVVVLV